MQNTMDKFTLILKASGVAIIFVAIADGILGIFNYQLEISGSPIPNFTWPYLVFMGIIGALIYFWGWRRGKKKANPKKQSFINMF
jgi:hypothetical protein